MIYVKQDGRGMLCVLHPASESRQQNKGRKTSKGIGRHICLNDWVIDYFLFSRKGG